MITFINVLFFALGVAVGQLVLMFALMLLHVGESRPSSPLEDDRELLRVIQSARTNSLRVVRGDGP